MSRKKNNDKKVPLSIEKDAIEMADDEWNQYPDKDPLAWEEMNTEHIIQDQWIDLRRSTYRLPDGKVYEPFYTYSRRNYVVIVATDTDGKYLCVRQFRQGIQEVTTEFPAGGIEPGNRKKKENTEKNIGENAGSGELTKKSTAGYVEKSTAGCAEKSTAGCDKKSTGGENRDNLAVEEILPDAKRELLEETGYESDEWRFLLAVPSNATISDNYAYLFVADNCRKVSGQKLDETEFLDVKKYSLREIEKMITEGTFQQAIHILAWLLSLQI